MLNRAALAMVLAVGWSTAALAGDQYVDGTGYALSGYDVVSYFDLQQADVGVGQPSPLPGSAALVADHNGARFTFATAANRDRFLANPEQFAPQYDGHCAYGVAKGAKVPGNPVLWRIVDGRLYLNITRDVAENWEADIPGNIGRADGNWGGIAADAASDDAIPDFASAAPVAH